MGSSFLVQGFGEGEFCTCGEVCLPGVPRTCPCCTRGKEKLLGEQDDVSGSGCSELDLHSTLLEQPGSTGQAVSGSGDMRDEASRQTGVSELDVRQEEPEAHIHEPPEEYFSQTCVETVELQALEFVQQGKFQHHECEQVLQHLQFPVGARAEKRWRARNPDI